MNQPITTVLYFHAYDRDVFPELLKLSILSYASVNQGNYLFVTNICLDLIPTDLLDYIKVVQIDEVLSVKDMILLDTLLNLWNDSSVINANCPQIEVHCFARWLSVLGLFEKGYIHKNSKVLCHDWDDIFLLGKADFKHLIEKNASNYDVIFGSNYDKIYHIYPHFLLASYTVFEKYKNAIISSLFHIIQGKLSIYSYRFDGKSFFSDMAPWAILLNRCLSGMNNLRCESWNMIFREKESPYHLCENFRYLNDRNSGTQVTPASYYIEPRYNYLDGNSEHLLAYKLFFDGAYCCVETNRGFKRLVNLHFQGVEGKYVFSKYLQMNIKNIVLSK